MRVTSVHHKYVRRKYVFHSEVAGTPGDALSCVGLGRRVRIGPRSVVLPWLQRRARWTNEASPPGSA